MRSLDGVSMIGELEPGDWVSLHWEWVCDRLTIRRSSTCAASPRHLQIVNDGNLHAGPAALLDG